MWVEKELEVVAKNPEQQKKKRNKTKLNQFELEESAKKLFVSIYTFSIYNNLSKESPICVLHTISCSERFLLSAKNIYLLPKSFALKPKSRNGYAYVNFLTLNCKSFSKSSLRRFKIPLDNLCILLCSCRRRVNRSCPCCISTFSDLFSSISKLLNVKGVLVFETLF